MTVTSQLVDARNWEQVKPVLMDKMSNAGLIGFDLETWDEPHDALAELRKSKNALIFDVNRTIVAGFSLYFDGDDVAYYVNLMHADEENRVPWREAREVLDAKPDNAYWVCHNAPFEICMCLKSLDYWLDNVVCTMQMAVSAYGPDEYDFMKFVNMGLGGIKQLLIRAASAFRGYDPYKDKEFTEEQEDLVGKVCAKQSTSSHSYNGFVQQISYGYGLKRAVKSFFNVQMGTFKETLGNKNHMGELTGDEVVDYGADDSYWAIQLFHRLLRFMKETNPSVIKTFFEQENPMVQVYGKLWADGIRVNEEGIRKGRMREREECARILRDLKNEVYNFLPFDDEHNPRMLELEDWYAKNADRYREKIQRWAEKPNTESDFEQVAQTNGAVSKPWAAETERKHDEFGPNFTHYMVMRTLLYDLLGERPMRQEGKVQSDGENRGRLISRIRKRIAERENAQTQVYNKHTDDIPEDAVNIMRGSGWGNPFKLENEDRREDVVEAYKSWLEEQLASGAITKEQLAELSGKALVCCCKPKQCHGDVLASYADWAAEELGYEVAPGGSTEADKRRIRIIELINQLAGVEQRMKLYLTPYTKMVDPNTGRLYPTISSKLATRRMASENPNTMQLAKRGESTYVRGFFLPDNDEHLLVSIDWTQIELVLIGELSGDPEFARAYGQLPYQDLHLGAAADGLSVMMPQVTEDFLNRMHRMTADDVKEIEPNVLVDVDGNELNPAKAKKYWRTVIGKGSNFNYWYSGALSTVGQTLGWSPEQMWAATDNYRERFAVAEQWRQNTIKKVQRDGYVMLPDNHRRVRFEATPTWGRIMADRFKAMNSRPIAHFGYEVCRRIQKRAGNQAVNALIQGTCSTLAKRSILRVNERIAQEGFDANFKIPVHDELVWSVNKREIPEFIRMAKEVMTNHPSIIGNLCMDATAAVGLTFEPWDPKKAPLGQIELDEAPDTKDLPVIPEEKQGGHLDDNEIRRVVEWLEQQRADQMKEAA